MLLLHYIYRLYCCLLRLLFSGLANSNVAIHSKVAAVCINPPNIRYEVFGSSASPAYVLIVVFYPFGFMGIANPIPALESKAISATTASTELVATKLSSGTHGGCSITPITPITQCLQDKQR